MHKQPKICITLLPILAAAMTLISCNKEIASSPIPSGDLTEERVPLTVGVRSSDIMTRATGVDSNSESSEAKVNSLQVFVFRGDDLDAYGSGNDVSELTLSCTAGDRSVYAIVNAPDLSSVSSKAALLATESPLSGNTLTNFVMVGSNSSVTLPQTEKITINVDRIAARVVISEISRDFTSSALASKQLTVNEIYISNVPAKNNFGLDYALTDAATDWYNMREYSASAVDALVYDALSSSNTIANSASYSTPHTFYAYPNATTADTSSSTWSPRHTRLVVKTTLGTGNDARIYYYPITLPELEPNKSYEISNLTLTRPGSDDPDTPVSFKDCTFKINVRAWTVVDVSDENATGITI